MEILSTDILVVGAGLAGFTAAVRAAEKGAKVILTDKSNGPFGDGNIMMVTRLDRLARSTEHLGYD